MSDLIGDEVFKENDLAARVSGLNHVSALHNFLDLALRGDSYYNNWQAVEEIMSMEIEVVANDYDFICPAELKFDIMEGLAVAKTAPLILFNAIKPLLKGIKVDPVNYLEKGSTYNLIMAVANLYTNVFKSNVKSKCTSCSGK